MERQKFFEALRDYLHRRKPELDPSTLTMHASLWELGYIDSVAMIELIVFVEQLTGKEISLGNEDVRSFGTIGGIYDNHVASRLSDQGA